jgi:hypothetical protein
MAPGQRTNQGGNKVSQICSASCGDAEQVLRCRDGLNASTHSLGHVVVGSARSNRLLANGIGYREQVLEAMLEFLIDERHLLIPRSQACERSLKVMDESDVGAPNGEEKGKAKNAKTQAITNRPKRSGEPESTRTRMPGHRPHR